MSGEIGKKLEKALGAKVAAAKPMRGGDIADVSCLTLSDGRKVVAKRPRADQPDTTKIEAAMLKHLKANADIPTPTVLFQTKGILVMDYIEHRGITGADAAAESVAHHAAILHNVRDKKACFGYEMDTVIGPLPQENRQEKSWVTFFRDRRLLSMARSCARTTKFDQRFLARIEALAEKLPDLIPDTPDASLLHGDMWAGNMLIDGDTAVGFIDPAISYGHREMDIAFVELMGGLSPVFLDAYQNAYPLEPGYKEERAALYQLWPLLVHVRLFGGGYVWDVDGILKKFGC